MSPAVSASLRWTAIAVAGVALVALNGCGGGGDSDLASSSSSSSSSGGGGGGGGSGSGTANSVPIVIDTGPTAAEPVQNLGYITVTLCVPGTTTCQTIDHVQIDTGSVGFRVLNAALGQGLTAAQLPAVTDASNGQPLAECVQYVDGYTFGSLRTADLKIAGEVASGITVQVIGDLENSIPAACSDLEGDPFDVGDEDTVASFGANAILGVQQFLEDCGPTCPTDGTAYNVCTTAATPVCTPVAVAEAAQVPNPVAKFASDNNGVVVNFSSGCSPGSVTASSGANPSSGGASCSGTLYFGIGTQSDNALGTVSLYTIDSNYGDVDTTFSDLNTTFAPSGGLLAYSYIDAGTSALFFPDNGNLTPALCSDASGFYCPTQVTALSAQIQGFDNSSVAAVPFSVGNFDAIDASTNPFQPFVVGDSGAGTDSFVWGLPFFYGRSVFVGFEGQSFGGVAGPLYGF